jgi:hypothetical protein
MARPRVGRSARTKERRGRRAPLALAGNNVPPADGDQVFAGTIVKQIDCPARPVPCVVALAGGTSAIVNDERMLAILVAAAIAGKAVDVHCTLVSTVPRRTAFQVVRIILTV